MNPRVFIIFSLLLLSLETRSANQLVAVGDAKGVTKKCSDKERHALLDFKTRLQDPGGRLFTWRAEEDCCTWFGVTCDNRTGYVTQLEIGNIFAGGLVGEISDSLLNLSYLNHLDLSSNSFNGTIPTFIGNMTKLRYLDLRSNHFNGTIPRSIGSLTKLRYLDLSGNFFYGPVPPEFGNLTNLQDLFLGSSLGSAVVTYRVQNLDWLSHLSCLQHLVMDGISLAKQNHWVDVVLSLPELSVLSLQECELSQVMYPYSSHLNSSSSILSLDLSYNNLTSITFRRLFLLAGNNLLRLYLSGNMLDGIPKYLGNLCSLTSLYMHDNTAPVNFPNFLENLSGCTQLKLQKLYVHKSQLTGPLSDGIQNFSSLEELVLYENQLSGTISEKLWELPRLKYLDVSSNNLEGVISENIGKSKPFTINLSKNSLRGVPSTYHMSNLSYAKRLDMNSCKLGPRFPKWVQTLKNLVYLDISNNGISDIVPMDFWDMWPSRLTYLNLSSNNITQKIPNLSSNFDKYSVIDFSANNFYGPIPNVSSTLVSLNLSRNKFYGGISFLCQIVDGFLVFLDLSHNFLTGQLPHCLWHFKELKVLNLGYNNLFGRIPTSIESLIKLEALDLYKNDFSGELPLSLKNCTSLNSLNLGANNFYGNVPVWIGENLSGLYVLILRSNNLFGTIPSQLCQLTYLQILDFSMNSLHGTIPSCLNNLTNMVQDGFSRAPNLHVFPIQWRNYGLYLFGYFDHAIIEWQGDEREFIKSNFGLLKSIDLSSNNLTGKIPYELTNLHELLALNLSKNSLLGDIPWKIGEMKKLLVLDLSRNNFSGGIPSNMSQMSSLSYLDVSYNSLSGRIPSSTQLQSFEPSRYIGNVELCGLPLTKKCPGDEESEVPPVVGKMHSDGENIYELWEWFYIGGGTGFVIGFWIVLGTLFVNRRVRHAFFHYYDSFNDWVYVKVVVFFANLHRVAHI